MAMEARSVSLGRLVEAVVSRCYNEIASCVETSRVRGTGEQKEEFRRVIIECKRKLMKLHVCVEWLRKRVRVSDDVFEFCVCVCVCENYRLALLLFTRREMCICLRYR